MAPLRFFSRRRGGDPEGRPEDAEILAPESPPPGARDGRTVSAGRVPVPGAEPVAEPAPEDDAPWWEDPPDGGAVHDPDTEPGGAGSDAGEFAHPVAPPEPADAVDPEAVPAHPEAADPGAHSDPVDRAYLAWTATLRTLSGVSPLFDMSELRGALLDLSRAHPSGIAQLYAGRLTRLSGLVREPGALAVARTSVRGVLQRAEELTQRYSAAPTYLVLGLARWADVEARSEGGSGETRLAHAPVLMRPIHIQVPPAPDDEYEFLLEPGIEVNPVLVRALQRAGAGADLEELAALSITEHGFSPQATLERIAEIGEAHLTDFEWSERIHVGPFVHPSQLLLDDLEAVSPLLRDHPVIRALAGDIEVKRRLSAPLPATSPRDRDPHQERGVGDLDPVQQGAIEQVASGRDLVLDARAGSSPTQVVAAILADAAASGRRVVHMPGGRRTGRAVVRALADNGLADLVLDLQDPAWRTTAPDRLRGGLEPWEDRLDDDAVRRTRASLVEIRGRLGDYTEALHRRRDEWDISAYDALQHLAELTTSAGGPSTRVRLGRETIGLLDEATRAEAGEKLTRFAVLGGFSPHRTDTPWFGARVRNQREASDALERSQILAEIVLPKVVSDVGRISQETGLTPAATLADWNEQLEMLEGVRESLDVFQPLVFERSAADMVIATATPAWRADHQVEMPAGTRRRLTKQAKDMLRPGVAVPDLHAALSQVQRHREVWRRHNPAGGWPHLPENLGEARRTARDATARLDGLTEVFPDTDLFAMTLEDLRAFLLRLAGDSAALRYLPELNTLDIQLNHLGLGALLADLRRREVDGEALAGELELCWWASVLEEILASDPTLAAHDGASLNALSDGFRELDRAQVATLPGPVRRAIDRRRAKAIAADKGAAQELWLALSRPQATNLRELWSRYPDLLNAARPIRVVPPLAVGQVLTHSRDIDLLVIDGAQHLSTAYAAAAIARARQVVVVADTTRPSAGLIDDLAGTLPAIVLPTDRSHREEHLASFLAGGGWDGVVDTVPSPPSPSRIRLHLVDGFGMPAVGAVAVEGVQPEVDRAVELARHHVLERGQTVAVISLSQVTASRIRSAVAADRELAPALADPDRLVVVDIEGAQGLRRDAVILSVGFGKTPHGRVLHRFGPISSPEGLALMLDALDAVVHDLDVVSCLAPEDFERDRLHHSGAELLAELLDFASDRPAEPGSTKARSQPQEGEPDRLLLDLTERLHRLGLVVVPRYGFEGGVRVPLAVGHPDRPGELFVGVLTDDARYVAEPSLRTRERYWVERLADHGWVPHMAFGQAVFMDPQREARAIAAKLRTAIREREDAEEAAAAAAARAQAAAREAAERARAGAAATARAEAEALAATERAAPAVTAEPDNAEPDAAGEPGDAPADVRANTGELAPVSEPAEEMEPSVPREPAAPGPLPEVDLFGESTGAVPRPDLPLGRPIREYSDAQLDALVAWIVSDGQERSTDELIDDLRLELGLSRRGSRIEQVLRAASERRG